MEASHVTDNGGQPFPILPLYGFRDWLAGGFQRQSSAEGSQSKAFFPCRRLMRLLVPVIAVRLF